MDVSFERCCSLLQFFSDFLDMNPFALFSLPKIENRFLEVSETGRLVYEGIDSTPLFKQASQKNLKNNYSTVFTYAGQLHGPISLVYRYTWLAFQCRL